MIEDKPIGFLLEGDIAADGGEITLYELNPNLPYGRRVLSFGYVSQKRRLLRKPLYRARVDLRHREEELSEIFHNWPVRNSLEDAATDVLIHDAECMAKLDPGKTQMVDVRQAGYELKKAIRIAAGYESTEWDNRDVKYR